MTGYLLRLPFRMAKAAVGVVLHDLDAALCLSAATAEIESMSRAFAIMAATPKEFRP